MNKSGRHGVVSKDNFPATRRKIYQVTGLGAGILNQAGYRLRVLHPPHIKMNRRVEVETPGPEVDIPKARSLVKRRY